jgi:hypothetical protein
MEANQPSDFALLFLLAGIAYIIVGVFIALLAGKRAESLRSLANDDENEVKILRARMGRVMALVFAAFGVVLALTALFLWLR